MKLQNQKNIWSNFGKNKDKYKKKDNLSQIGEMVITWQKNEKWSFRAKYICFLNIYFSHVWLQWIIIMYLWAWNFNTNINILNYEHTHILHTLYNYEHKYIKAYVRRTTILCDKVALDVKLMDFFIWR